MQFLFSIFSTFAFASICFAAFGLWSTIFWIITIVDVLRSKDDDKTAWVIAVIFLHVFGAVLYRFIKISDRQLDPLLIITLGWILVSFTMCCGIFTFPYLIPSLPEPPTSTRFIIPTSQPIIIVTRKSSTPIPTSFIDTNTPRPQVSPITKAVTNTYTSTSTFTFTNTITPSTRTRTFTPSRTSTTTRTATRTRTPIATKP